MTLTKKQKTEMLNNLVEKAVPISEYEEIIHNLKNYFKEEGPDTWKESRMLAKEHPDLIRKNSNIAIDGPFHKTMTNGYGPLSIDLGFEYAEKLSRPYLDIHFNNNRIEFKLNEDDGTWSNNWDMPMDDRLIKLLNDLASWGIRHREIVEGLEKILSSTDSSSVILKILPEAKEELERIQKDEKGSVKTESSQYGESLAFVKEIIRRRSYEADH